MIMKSGYRPPLTKKWARHGWGCYVCPVTTVASILLGADGSTAKGGNSIALRTPADESRFLSQRRSGDVIVIGGATARAESYARTPTALVIVSHTEPETLHLNPQSVWWEMSPGDAVRKAQREYGEKVFIEGGISFLRALLEEELVDELRISVSPAVNGTHKVSLQELLAKYSDVVKDQVEETTFYTCSQLIKQKK